MRPVPLESLERKSLPLLTDLIYAAAPNFYDCFALPDETRHNALMADLTDEASELGTTWIFADHGIAYATASFYPGTEFLLRQATSLKNLLELSPEPAETLGRLRAYRKRLPTQFPTASIYLARIAVNPNRVGRGIASKILAQLEGYGASQKHSQLTLHVAENNVAAIALYKKHKYTVTEHVPGGYFLLAKPLGLRPE